jgi:hypothetical protein
MWYANGSWNYIQISYSTFLYVYMFNSWISIFFNSIHICERIFHELLQPHCLQLFELYTPQYTISLCITKPCFFFYYSVASISCMHFPFLFHYETQMLSQSVSFFTPYDFFFLPLFRFCWSREAATLTSAQTLKLFPYLFLPPTLSTILNPLFFLTSLSLLYFNNHFLIFLFHHLSCSLFFQPGKKLREASTQLRIYATRFLAGAIFVTRFLHFRHTRTLPPTHPPTQHPYTHSMPSNLLSNNWGVDFSLLDSTLN